MLLLGALDQMRKVNSLQQRCALGCGGVVEGDWIVLQGDHRDRLPALLEKRGVRRVVKG